MTLKYTPKSNSTAAPDFTLKATDGQQWTLEKAMGPNGLVVMFICNHCPFVKSIQNQLVEDTLLLQEIDVHVIAIMSNDPDDYPEDSFENMRAIAEEKQYPFPYVIDETQAVAKAYGAVCTPDIFGINAQGVIQYRGRLNAAGINDNGGDLRKDLVEAMREMVKNGSIQSEQFPSMGCSIKWKQQE